MSYVESIMNALSQKWSKGEYQLEDGLKILVRFFFLLDTKMTYFGWKKMWKKGKQL